MHRHPLLAVFAVLFFGVVAKPAIADNRVALIIGNGAYAHAPHLPNPPHDAEDVAAALKRSGFQTILAVDLDQAGMQDAAIRFARAARNADVAVFYYSGHAMQYAGVNYLVPIDAELHDEADLRRMARVDDILADLQQAKNLRILVLDSCRDNPLADELKRSIGRTRSASIGRGLAKMESQNGTIISYSTQAGGTAMDGDGRNSPYTSAFLKHIEDKDEVSTVFHHISASVYDSTSGSQTPELSLSFFGEFYLNGKLQITIAPATTPAPVDPCAAANDHWKSAEAIGTVDAYQDHLARFPNCTFAGLAKARIANLSSKIAPPAPLTAPSVSNTPAPSAPPQQKARLAAAQTPSSFQTTCADVSVHGSTLSATCRRIDGSWSRTAIAIDGVENINGNLQYTGASPSSYQLTCKKIGASGDLLVATCARIDGRWQRTSMPIPGIANIDGVLRYE